MKIYRGPRTDFYRDRKLVKKIKATEFASAIAGGQELRFEISKDAKERHSDCRIRFDSDEWLPTMIELLKAVHQELERHRAYQSELYEIATDFVTSDTQLIKKLRHRMYRHRYGSRY
ncbi:hypothetical protein GCM10027034_19880 [Ramlibacter solisilvae]|uniref:hypothetical protein n=1 Tax=Ramlibacter tataouinensis TaxID=94132 RepID=UPI0011AE9770|nr:hypothetical protein [Ramlibacter tataouinensis]